MVCASLLPFSIYSANAAGLGKPVSVTVLVALLVCLAPTTIGGLLSAIGIAGMDRLIQANVIAMSGRAVEAAGGVDVLHQALAKAFSSPAGQWQPVSPRRGPGGSTAGRPTLRRSAVLLVAPVGDVAFPYNAGGLEWLEPRPDEPGTGGGGEGEDRGVAPDAGPGQSRPGAGRSGHDLRPAGSIPISAPRRRCSRSAAWPGFAVCPNSR